MPFVIGFLVSVLALITLSVKRGLHEKMYPTLDEITPSRAAGGTSATCSFTGRTNAFYIVVAAFGGSPSRSSYELSTNRQAGAS